MHQLSLERSEFSFMERMLKINLAAWLFIAAGVIFILAGILGKARTGPLGVFFLIVGVGLATRGK